ALLFACSSKASAPHETRTLSLHDALPISRPVSEKSSEGRRCTAVAVEVLARGRGERNHMRRIVARRGACGAGKVKTFAHKVTGRSEEHTSGTPVTSLSRMPSSA